MPEVLSEVEVLSEELLTQRRQVDRMDELQPHHEVADLINKRTVQLSAFLSSQVVVHGFVLVLQSLEFFSIGLFIVSPFGKLRACAHYKGQSSTCPKSD